MEFFDIQPDDFKAVVTDNISNRGSAFNKTAEKAAKKFHRDNPLAAYYIFLLVKADVDLALVKREFEARLDENKIHNGS